MFVIQKCDKMPPKLSKYEILFPKFRNLDQNKEGKASDYCATLYFYGINWLLIFKCTLELIMTFHKSGEFHLYICMNVHCIPTCSEPEIFSLYTVRNVLCIPACMEPEMLSLYTVHYVLYEPTCMEPEMLSLSLRISWRFFVPKMFRRVVWASSLQNIYTHV